MTHRLGYPAIGTGIERTWGRPSRPALQVHEQGQIVVRVLRSGDDAVELGQRLAAESLTWALARPIVGNGDRMILDIQSGHVVPLQQGHDRITSVIRE